MKQFFILILLVYCLPACQSSQNTDEKFKKINFLLENQLSRKYELTLDVFKIIKKAIRMEGNSPEGLKRLKRLNLLFDETDKVLEEVENLKSQMRMKLNTSDKDTKSQPLINEVEAQKLKSTLDKFTKWLNEAHKDLFGEDNIFSSLMAENKDNPIMQNTSFQNKSLFQTHFKNAGYYENLTYLTQIQINIIRYEQEVMKRSSAIDSNREIKFDAVIPITIPQKSVLKQGEVFEADLFLTNTAFLNQKNFPSNQSITLNGKPLMRNFRNRNQVVFPNQKQGTFEWKSTVTLKHRGKDTTFAIHKTYQVLPKNQLNQDLQNFIIAHSNK